MKSVYHLGKSQKYAQKCEDEDSLKMHFESKKDTNKKIINHINCSIIQGFSAQRKAETTLVKKITIIFCFYANQLLTRHSHFAPLGRVDK